MKWISLFLKTLNCACGVGYACSGVGMNDRPRASNASSNSEGVQLPLVNTFMYCDSPIEPVALVPFCVPVLSYVGGGIVGEVELRLLGGCWGVGEGFVGGVGVVLVDVEGES